MVVKKWDALFSQGDTSKHLCFITQGILRTFYNTKFENESTRIIALENQFCGSLSSFFIQQTPSFETIEDLKDAILLKVFRNDFYEILEKSPKMNKLYRMILEEIQIFNMWRI